MTTDQIRLIKRFTPNIKILYDGDAAGIKAAVRGLDMVLEEDMNVKIVLLPDKEALLYHRYIAPLSFTTIYVASLIIAVIGSIALYVIYRSSAQNEP